MALDTEQLPQSKMLVTQRLQQQQRAIAPAPAALMGHNFSKGHLYVPYPRPAPAYINPKGTTLDSNNPSVVRRNARERNRVKQVNNGFVHLRQHIPQAIVADLSNGRRGGTGPGASKKLSKVDTLRMALEYIRRLQRVINEVDQSDASSVSSYGGSSAGSSLSGSPPPAVAAGHFMPAHYYQQQQEQFQQSTYNALSYAGSFQQQKEQMLISPTASVSSSTYSDSYSRNNISENNINSITFGDIQLKYEQTGSYEEYQRQHNCATNEDEELLDYITLWQEDI